METSRQAPIKAHRASLLLASALALLIAPFLARAWIYDYSILSGTTETIGFGTGVAFSPSSTFLAVSAPFESVDDTSAAGVVRVFSPVDEKWTLMSTLTSATPLGDGLFGFAIAMTDEQLFVSATSAENGAGAIEIFSLSGSDWVAHQIITGTTVGDGLGSSLALSDDGSLLVSGAIGCDSNLGCIFVFTLDSNGEWTEHAKLSGATTADAKMGVYSLSIDSTAILTGAFLEDDEQGAAYIWARQNTDITPTAQRLTTTAPLDENGGALGFSAAFLSSTTLVLGAPYVSSVVIFTLSSTTNTWEQDSIVAGPTGSFGFGLKLVFDSGRLIITMAGAPLIYTVSGKTISDTFDILYPTSGVVALSFGVIGIALKGNNIAVGDSVFIPARREAHKGGNTAVVGDSMFNPLRREARQGGNITVVGDSMFNPLRREARQGDHQEGVYFFHLPHIQKVKSSGKSKSKGTGHKVAFWSDMALVSVPFCFDTTTTCDGGYINLYRKGTSSTDWKFHKKVRNPFRNRENKFGYNMIVNDNYLIVSAPASTYIEQDVGILALFTWDCDQDTFIKNSIIRYRKTTEEFKLGSALSNLNSVTAIGLPEYDESSDVTNSGSALIFKKKDNGKWGQRKTITSPSPSTDENFGQSVSLQSETRVAVSNNPCDKSLQAVFIFDLVNGEWEFGQKIFDVSKLGFGWKILFHSDLLYISAMYDATIIADGGSITVYNAGGDGKYEFSYSFQPQSLIASKFFGYSFATDGTRFVVGTKPCGECPFWATEGSAYTFTKDGDDKWAAQYRITYGLKDGSDEFGFDVAVSGGDVLISAPFDSSASRTGVVYFVSN